MAPKPNLECFDVFTSRFLRAKVRQLIGRAGFTESDRNDLLQRFAENLHRRRTKFKPNRGNWEAFVVVISENLLATIIEERSAEKRDFRRNGCSLNTNVTDGDGTRVEMSATLSDADDNRHGAKKSAADSAELVMDMAELLDALSADDRDICERLKCNSLSAVARELGMSRDALRKKIKLIRQRFENTEMRAYL
jgi:RNA polymerase sigma-70 factor, ECF subfamily